MSPRLRPLDLTHDELAERRRLVAGAVVVLSNTWAVEISDVLMLGDWEGVSYRGLVLPCVLGVADLPVGELVSFEPSHVEAIFERWQWERLSESDRRRRPPSRRTLMAATFNRALPRTRGGIREALNMRTLQGGPPRDPLD